MGLAATPAYFALRAQRLMIDAGVTKQQLAEVVVKNRANGVDNPDAMFRSKVTAAEVLGSKRVCEPLHLFMLCSPNEGAAAVVLRAGDGGVQVRAAALRSHQPGHVLDEGSPLCGLVDSAVPPPTALAASDAYEASGVGPDDLDVVECQDTDAARELLAYEELGLCGPGGCGELLDSGATRLGGRLPVNASGGLLSKGEPLGASAVAQVVELTRQLQGRCGPRQVPHARVALAQTVGRGANASVTILTR
jgi:acetyl-CoA acetyltransferase